MPNKKRSLYENVFDEIQGPGIGLHQIKVVEYVETKTHPIEDAFVDEIQGPGIGLLFRD